MATDSNASHTAPEQPAAPRFKGRGLVSHGTGVDKIEGWAVMAMNSFLGINYVARLAPISVPTASSVLGSLKCTVDYLPGILERLAQGLEWWMAADCGGCDRDHVDDAIHVSAAMAELRAAIPIVRDLSKALHRARVPLEGFDSLPEPVERPLPKRPRAIPRLKIDLDAPPCAARSRTRD